MPSDEWYNNIYPPIGVRRITTAEVIYSLVAPEAKDGGLLETPKGNKFSRKDQVLNNIQHIDYPIATQEPNYWRLDGTFILPLPPDKPGTEVGWWSDVMSDENGVLNPPQIITREFDSVKAFTSLGIAFDRATDNYCTDFEAFFYNTAGEVTHYEHITDNASFYGRTLKAGFNIIKVVIVLNKTSKPFRYARVAEIDFGVYLKFDDSDIKSITAVSETDPMGKSVPLPEFRLSILNKGRFDQLDAQSYAPFMQTRQKFEYNHGLVLPDGSTEFVDCGSYILKDWSVSDSVVSFIATGKTSELENSSFFDSSFEQLTVAQFVKKLFPEAVINIESPYVTAFLGNINYRRALTCFAELSSCLVFEDRRNTVQFKDVINEMFGITRMNYHLDGSWRLGEKPFVNTDVITYENVYSKPNPEQTEYFNGINLMEYSMSIEERQISKTEHSVSGNVEILIYFSNPIVGTPLIEVTQGFTLSSIRWRTMYMSAMLSGNGLAEIIISGQSVTLTKEQVFYPAPWNTGKEPAHPYDIDLPMMIRLGEFEIFREWFLDRKFKMLAKRLNVSISRRQNPAQFLGDTVAVQLNNKGGENPMLMVKQEINYSGGALKGSSKLIGEVKL